MPYKIKRIELVEDEQDDCIDAEAKSSLDHALDTGWEPFAVTVIPGSDIYWDRNGYGPQQDKEPVEVVWLRRMTS
jgi:hypothetical protein